MVMKTRAPMKPRKLPLPDQILVLGVPFRVQVVDTVDAEGSVGETAGELRLIKIADSQDTRRQWTTLLHEFFHATLDVMGASSILDPDVEEMIVQSLEHSMEQFLLSHGDSFMRALDVQK